MRLITRLFLIIMIFMIAVLPAQADDNGLSRLTYGEDMWISLHYLLQAQIYTQNGYVSSDGEAVTGDWTKGFQLRRSRIILNGQVTKNIEFFMQTDDILIGNQSAGSQYSSSTNGSVTTDDDSKGVFTQDAYMEYRFNDAAGIAVGLMPIPFMHHSMESAVSQLGIDYNTTVIPLGSTTNNWRDTGLEVKGLAGDIFDYRVGIFRGQPKDLNDSSTGSDDVNTDSAPRFSARMQLNLADPERGFFYSGNYLGRKNVIAIGAGVDYQNNATVRSDEVFYYIAYTADATIDYKINDNLTGAFQGAYVYVINQPGASVKKQNGYFVQAGALLYGSFQPVIKYQFWKGDNVYANDVETSYLSGGLNYFINGHNANVKFEYQTPVIHEKDFPGEKKATLQFQVFI